MKSSLLFVAILTGIILVRLPGLRDPLFGLHHVRMNETAAIARNFYENSMNILYPQISWGGNGPGYSEDAFQLYAFLVALLYKVFGVSDVVGRGLSLFSFVLSAVMLFLLARRLFNQRAALFALFFFGVAPLGIYYGRSFQPDPLMLLCSLAAVYLFLVWTETGREVALWGSALALSAAVLTKPLNLYLGLPLLYLCHRLFGWGLLRQWRLWLYAPLPIVPMVLWYWHAHRLWLEYGNTNGMWTLPWLFGSPALWSDPSLYRELAKRLVYKITTVAGAPLLLLGLVLRQPSRVYLAQIWAAAFGVAVLITAGAQKVHDYYQLPMLPVASLLMAYAADYLWAHRPLKHTLLPEPLTSKTLILGLCLLAVGSAAQAMQIFYRMPPNLTDQLAFASRLRALTEPGSLVILGSSISRGPEPASAACCRHREPDGQYLGHEPVEFYQSHRKGWSIHYEDWSIELVEALQKRGAMYFASSHSEGLNQQSEFLRLLGDRYTLLERNPKWVIFRLDRAAAEAQ